MYHLIWWMVGRAVLEEAGRSWHSPSNAPTPFAGKMSVGGSLFMHGRELFLHGSDFGIALVSSINLPERRIT
jgi:hypothetical protein